MLPTVADLLARLFPLPGFSSRWNLVVVIILISRTVLCPPDSCILCLGTNNRTDSTLRCLVDFWVFLNLALQRLSVGMRDHRLYQSSTYLVMRYGSVCNWASIFARVLDRWMIRGEDRSDRSAIPVNSLHSRYISCTHPTTGQILSSIA